MTSLKDFFNPILGDTRIFTRDDLKEMSPKEYNRNERAINYQLLDIGIPTNRELQNNSDVVYVRSYTKDDGTFVKAHFRSKPDNSQQNNLNYSTKSINSYQKQIADFSDLEKWNPFGFVNAKLNEKRPNARELLNLSLINGGIENAPQSDEYFVISNSETPKINKALGINNSSLQIDNSWSGVSYNEDSSFSKNLSNSPQLQEQVKNYCKRNTLTNKSQILIDLNQDTNLFYSIGHGTILNPAIDEKGYFSGLLFDKYDYDFITNDKNNFKTKFINNSAYILQNYKIIQNYYTLIPIKFKIK